MSKEESLNTARRLVQEAVDIANSAGIDPSSVLSPHCSEIDVKDNSGDDPDSKNLTWCGIQVIIDNNTDGLFEMPELDDHADQKPAFHVTQSTAHLVRQDYERYKPSLERMLEDWQEEKQRFMQDQVNKKEALRNRSNARELSFKNSL
jgi:hypothetical protein